MGCALNLDDHVASLHRRLGELHCVMESLQREIQKVTADALAAAALLATAKQRALAAKPLED